MNKFNTNNSKTKVLKVIMFSLLVFSYYYIIKNTNFIDKVTTDIKEKYNNEEINIEKFKTEIVYKSLNKIIDINDLNISKSNSSNYKVYLYNTHDTEKYSLPFTSDYSITPDVKLASKILKEYLNNYNIDVYLETSSMKKYLSKNKLKYTDSYEASRYYLKKNLTSEYKLIIDIHRDSIRHKYTLYEKDNIKYARVLFIISTSHKNYKKNKKVADTLNNILNENYKGISRGVSLRDDITYNQDLNENIILIKIGGIDSTLEEINNTVEVLSKTINEYLKELWWKKKLLIETIFL